MTIEKILIVDDDAAICEFLVDALKMKGLEAVSAASAEEALKLFQNHSFDLVVTDMKMSQMTGLDLLKKIKELSPKTIVMIMTGHGSVENAVEAMQAGAFHYLLKPFSLQNLLASIEKAKQHLVLIEENHYLRQQSAPHALKQTIVAESPAMKKILQEVHQIAKSNANVFIHGETGTGKEVIANLVHQLSPRNQNPFIKVNCAAIPEALIESEFFGHEKGAFTGAVAKRIGRFELADKGSLLLDEVTEIPLSLQAKLLRVTQEQEFERVGGNKSLFVDARLISTSNRSMQEAIASKLLREDLYYRLNVIPIHLPPLRERREDIIPLANYFIERTCQENHVERKTLLKDAEKVLIDYEWPGNVRELANVIERAIVLDEEKTISRQHLMMEPGTIISTDRKKSLADLEKQLIIETLQLHQDPSIAAESLGIPLHRLQEKLSRYKDST